MMRWVASRNSTSQMTGRQGLLTKLLKDAMKSAADFPAKLLVDVYKRQAFYPGAKEGGDIGITFQGH